MSDREQGLLRGRWGTTESGREARFYLGTLYLEPSNPAYDVFPSRVLYSAVLST